MRDEAQRPRNEGRGEGDDADADPAETSRTERRRKKYVREAVTERDKKGEAAQAASPQKGTMTAHRGAHVTV